MHFQSIKKSNSIFGWHKIVTLSFSSTRQLDIEIGSSFSKIVSQTKIFSLMRFLLWWTVRARSLFINARNMVTIFAPSSLTIPYQMGIRFFQILFLDVKRHEKRLLCLKRTRHLQWTFLVTFNHKIFFVRPMNQPCFSDIALRPCLDKLYNFSQLWLCISSANFRFQTSYLIS